MKLGNFGGDTSAATTQESADVDDLIKDLFGSLGNFGPTAYRLLT